MPLLLEGQRTADWYAARQGKITASLAAACLGLDPHRGPLAAFNEITGQKAKTDNKHMAWGREFEAQARADYECETGFMVSETGLWVHPRYDWLAASPDGLIGPDGLLEIKCPTKVPETAPVQHLVQMRIQMACTGRSWCDYFAWVHPGSEFAGTYRQHVSRDDLGENTLIENLESWYREYVLTGTPPPRRRREVA